jgi:tRNA-modifying protein YgfZ
MLCVDHAIANDELAGFVAGTISLVLPLDVVTVVGPDAQKFLHSLLSQNILTIDVGASAWSFLLQPQGKVIALVFVTREAEESFTLRCDVGAGESLRSALTRYKIRTKCELELAEAIDCQVQIQNRQPCFRAVSESVEAALRGEQASYLYAAARIELGWPSFPHEVDEATIPNETGVLDAAVNFTKGCYVGQELVERIASRAVATPRRLVRLKISGLGAGLGAGAPGPACRSDESADRSGDEVGPTADDAGALGNAELRVGDKVVGTLTTVVSQGTFTYALGYVARSVSDSATDVAVVVDSVSFPVEVENIAR